MSGSGGVINSWGAFCWCKSLCRSGSSVGTSACPGTGSSLGSPCSKPPTDPPCTCTSMQLPGMTEGQDKAFHRFNYMIPSLTTCIHQSRHADSSRRCHFCNRQQCSMLLLDYKIMLFRRLLFIIGVHFTRKYYFTRKCYLLIICDHGSQTQS